MMNRSLSPLQQNYNALGSYKKVELKLNDKNPPINSAHIRKSYAKICDNDDKGRNGESPDVDIEENGVRILNANKDQQNDGRFVHGRHRSFNHMPM